MIDHVTLYVYDLAESKLFYEKVFLPFGYRIAFGKEQTFWAFAMENGTLFEIAQYKGNIELAPCHIAFRANNREQVDQFYQAALQAGGKCNGAPGPRPQYTDNYYAAFILDINGYNIEAVYDTT